MVRGEPSGPGAHGGGWLTVPPRPRRGGRLARAGQVVGQVTIDPELSEGPRGALRHMLGNTIAGG